MGWRRRITFGMNSPNAADGELLPLHGERYAGLRSAVVLRTDWRAGVNRHSYFGFPDANFLQTNDDILTLKANHTLRRSGNVDVHTIARWANYPRDVQITEPQICSNVSVSTPVGGYVAALPTSAVNTALPCAYTPSTPAGADYGEPQPAPDQERGRRSVGPDGGDGAVQGGRECAMTLPAAWRAGARYRTRSGPAIRRTRSIQCTPTNLVKPNAAGCLFGDWVYRFDHACEVRERGALFCRHDEAGAVVWS